VPRILVRCQLRSRATLQGDPAIDSLANSIEAAWNSGEFKRACNIFHSVRKISDAEFRNSYSFVSLLAEYLYSAKLYREGLLAADILVAVYPNLFQAHISRTRALTMLHLWEAAAQEAAVVRRLSPSLPMLTAYEQDMASSAAKHAAASQGALPHSDIGDAHRAPGASSDDDVVANTWSNILHGLFQASEREFIPYIIFDAAVGACFVAVYSYMVKIKAATAKASKAVVAPAAAVNVVQPAAAPRRPRT